MLNIDAKSELTLPSDSSSFEFHGNNYSVALNNQNIADCDFNGAASITGIATATAGVFDPTFFLCGIGSVTLPPSNGFECGFFGTFTLGTEGNFTFGASAAVFGLSPIIDFGAALNASGFFLPNWTGGEMTIKNYGVGTGTYEFEMSGNGDLVIDSTCTGGSIIVRGNISVTDNSGGAVTVIKLANISSIQDEIGTAGAGLTDLGGMSTAMKAEVNVEADTALTDYDPPTRTEATSDKDEVITQVNANETKIDAVKVDTAATLVDTSTTIPASIDALPTATEITADMDANSTQLAALIVDTGTDIPALIAALNDLSAAQVNAEVVDVIDTDTSVEVTSPPAATSSLRARIGWLFALARNKITQTATTATLRNDDDDGSIATSTDSDDGTTATRGEWTP